MKKKLSIFLSVCFTSCFALWMSCANTNNPGVISVPGSHGGQWTPFPWTRIGDGSATNGNTYWVYNPDNGVSWTAFAYDGLTASGTNTHWDGTTPNGGDRVSIQMFESWLSTRAPLLDVRGDLGSIKVEPSYLGTSGHRTTISTNGIATDGNLFLGTNLIPVVTNGQVSLWMSNYDLWLVTPLKTNQITVGH